MDLDTLIKRLETDCNSLNAFSGAFRYVIGNKADILLSIEHRIFLAIDYLIFLSEQENKRKNQEDTDISYKITNGEQNGR